MLNYSAAVIPVTKADKAIDVADASYLPLNNVDKLTWDACMLPTSSLSPVPRRPSRNVTLTSGEDDPEIYHAAPVGVQLVARKFEEEKILAIAGIVTAALRAYRK